MALNGTLVKDIEITTDEDAILEIFSHKPCDISKMCPEKIQGVDVLDGKWGSVGSVVVWKYHHDGKDRCNKNVIAAMDKEKKLVTYKVTEGSLMELYKSISFTIQVETKGPKHLVTWTTNYEKRNENVEDPHSLMEFCLGFTKDIDTYQHEH